MQDDIRVPIMVRQIEQLDGHTLGIEWSDGHRGRWRLSHVRRHCQCATCNLLSSVGQLPDLPRPKRGLLNRLFRKG